MGPRVQYSFTILGLLSVQLDLYQLKRTVTMTVIHTIIYIIMIITIYINHPVCRTAEPSCFRRRADGRSSAHETRNFLRRPCTDTTPTLAGAATPTPPSRPGGPTVLLFLSPSPPTRLLTLTSPSALLLSSPSTFYFSFSFFSLFTTIYSSSVATSPLSSPPLRNHSTLNGPLALLTTPFPACVFNQRPLLQLHLSSPRPSPLIYSLIPRLGPSHPLIALDHHPPSPFLSSPTTPRRLPLPFPSFPSRLVSPSVVFSRRSNLLVIHRFSNVSVPPSILSIPRLPSASRRWRFSYTGHGLIISSRAYPPPSCGHSRPSLT